MTRKILLVCGILSSLVYLSIDLAALLKYPGYDFFSQTISELSAIGAPSRSLVVALGDAYTVLIIAFGLGVWLSAGDKWALRAAGALLIAEAVFGAFWPPMHMRGAGVTLTDTLHIAWTAGWLVLTMAALGFARTALGKPFLYYTLATIALVILFGVLTGLQGPRIPQNLPTPWAGVTERIGIGAFLLWIVVLGVVLWPQPRLSAALQAAWRSR
ncbi:MAG TPA: DUF998 domain-containing protein [Candidatus Rubrimentiphilum sp.]|nr:DUF998 domain-containing protein [Candidatus Rubrimentiphilum sp.]